MKVFDLQGNGTNFVGEILAGITTFVTTSYLLIECPAMFEGKGVASSTVYIGMCIACFIGCLLMGLWAKQPFVVAPSIGLTATFTSGLMTGMQYTYQEAMAIAFMGGVIYLILAMSGFGVKIYTSLSGSMKSGISAGLGIYIALLGLRNAGFLIGIGEGKWRIADLAIRNLEFYTVMVMFGGLVVIGFFKRFGLPFPLTVGILSSAVMYYVGGKFLHFVEIPPFERPAFHTISAGFNGNFGTWYKEGFLRNLTEGMGGVFSGLSLEPKTLLTLAVTILVCSLFSTVESAGVIFSIAKNHGKLDENGNFGAFKTTLSAGSASSLMGTLFGCPMAAVAPESTAGICTEGKVGLTSVTAGILFLLAAFFPSVPTLVPPVITSCVMVFIGFTMLGSIKDIDCGDISEGIPALMIIILITLTSSIIEGIALGIVVHIAINICTLKLQAVKPLELIIAVLFGLHYFMPVIR